MLKIKIICTEIKLRPRTNIAVLEELERLITKWILEPKKIIVGGSWGYDICISITDANWAEPFIITPTKTITADKLKYTVCLVNVNRFSWSNSVERNIEIFKLAAQVVDAYLSQKFKKFTAGDLISIIENMDLSFLKKYEYPAEFEHQGVLDEGTPKIKEEYLNYFKNK